MQKICTGEKIASSRSSTGKNYMSRFKIMKLNLYLLPIHKINSKWIKDLKLLEETLTARRKHRCKKGIP